jgi:hypothetical protein
MASRCALWARVGKDEQESGVQLGELRAEAARRGLDITAEYVLDGASAWKGEQRELPPRRSRISLLFGLVPRTDGRASS